MSALTKKPKATKKPLKNKRSFQSALVRWFGKNGKSYPWRETQDPWAILVSEIMLQQTQIATVLGKGHYIRFMSLFPTPVAMAEASEQKVLKTWEGLGYYRRARNLHAAAKAITRDHGGIFPDQFEQIRALPGIGAYTAGAVASFAFGESQPIVDANVARVFARLFDYQERVDGTQGNKQLWQWAEELVPAKQAREYNSALMELGQTYCSNKSPDCIGCPVNGFCQTRDPESLPLKRPSQKVTRTSEFAILSEDSHGRVLLEKINEGERREGMWRLPRIKHADSLDLPLLSKTTYSITRYHVTLRVYQELRVGKKLSGREWVNKKELSMIPMPSPERKVIDALLSG